jgi:phenylalanine-4-hydroxylase
MPPRHASVCPLEGPDPGKDVSFRGIGLYGVPRHGNPTRVNRSDELLAQDHPGFADGEYRARRAAIAAVAESYERGHPIPTVSYAPEEDALWEIVARELRVKHENYACAEYLQATDRLALPTDRVPQLGQASGRLEWLTGFRLEPVPGLVPTRTFYAALAERRFLATQYIRHHSVPFYTPEPDVVHELVGHANMLASPLFAALYQAAGRASRRAHTDAALEFFSKVFWFSLEFGVLWERGELRTYGAGLLSSFGELDVFRDAEIRPLDIATMGTLEYDITRYQPVLFAARSIGEVVDVVGGFFESFDDAAVDRLSAVREVRA